MRNHIYIYLYVLVLAGSVFPQMITSVTPTAVAVKGVENSVPMDLAKAALAAHGGDKLKQMKTLVLKGTVDVSAGTPQTIPATFAMIMSGDKYYFELDNPLQPLKQIYDGQRMSSVGPQLPPMTSLGFPLLPRIGDSGYVVSSLPEAKKKKHGFRITTPEGFYTDFFSDDKTNQLKSYESSYDMGGRLVTTSVQIDECQMVEGVLVPKRYSQRFDLAGQISAYASFKSKEILVNTPISGQLFRS